MYGIPQCWSNLGTYLYNMKSFAGLLIVSGALTSTSRFHGNDKDVSFNASFFVQNTMKYSV